MDYEEFLKMVRVGDSSIEACAWRLKGAWKVTEMTKTDFAKAVGVGLTAFINAEKAASYPSRSMMLYLYRSHRIDPTFILTGDYGQLPGDVQRKLYDAFSELARDKDQPAN